jgi:hypothetical protein
MIIGFPPVFADLTTVGSTRLQEHEAWGALRSRDFHGARRSVAARGSAPRITEPSMKTNPLSRPLAGREDPAPQPDPRRDREPAEEEEE